MNQLELFTMSEAALREILAHPPAPFEGALEADISEDEDAFDPEAVVENAMREVASSVVKKRDLRFYMEAYTNILNERRPHLFSYFEKEMEEALGEIAYGIWFVIHGSRAMALRAECADVEITPEAALDYLGPGMEEHAGDLRKLHGVLMEALERVGSDEVLVFRGDHL
jgi:hypothetical protein